MSTRADRVHGLVLAGSLATVAYTYVGYPVLAALRGAVRRRPYDTGPFDGRVSVVIAAHNEAAVIGDKLRSVDQSVPEGIDVEIIVVDDGSSDGTADVAERSGGGVVVVRLPRSGKAAALNAGVQASGGDILVFTDANSMFEPGTLTALLAPFADPAVGGVAGDQRYLGDAGSAGERLHWSFDRLLKRSESVAGSTVSATGALYAIRRRFFESVPEGVTDDFFVSTGVVAAGSRLVFAPDAVALERAAESPGREYSRKVRVMTRGLRAVVLRSELLAPRQGFYALSLLSRKVLRRLTAVPLVLAAASSTMRPRRSVLSAIVATITWSIAGLGAVGFLAPPRIARRTVFSVPAFVMLSVAAALRALSNTVAGVRIKQWETPGTTGQPR